ncbi:MAG TPA: DUF6308 family protein [Candidatus Dormibacteraeota bacterium]|nr:DUF6308 family protein [Candidatus Dormibacteraeota bacterium]
MNQPLRIRRPDLVVDDPWELIHSFINEDRSSIGERSYDSYIASGTSPLNRIVLADVVAINTTMGARSPHSDWAAVIRRGVLTELKAIDVKWDLFSTPNEIWARRPIGERVGALLDAVMGKGIGLARATKVLHMKRPQLIPICDSYVLRLMGLPGEDGSSVAALIAHLRSLREELLPTLVDIREKLLELGYDRTLLRIADALIWRSYPDTGRIQRLARASGPRR